jgi:hypothetical protein
MAFLHLVRKVMVVISMLDYNDIYMVWLENRNVEFEREVDRKDAGFSQEQNQTHGLMWDQCGEIEL